MLVKTYKTVHSSELRQRAGHSPDLLQLRILDENGQVQWVGESSLPEDNDAYRANFKRVKARLVYAAKKDGY